VTVAAALLVAAAVAVLVAGRLHVLLHTLQQEHYENARLYRWVRADWRRLQPLLVVAVLLGGVPANWLGVAFAALGFAGALVWSRRMWRRKQVKPLVFTARAKRLFGAALLISVAPSIAAALLGDSATVGITGGLGLLALPWLLGLANTALRPYQQLENRRYVRSAQRKLADIRPLVIGISGSFGKTTTKGCVAAALDAHGPTYPTPASFNSFLGVVRAINEGLEPRHETFVAELGSYRIGDVAELCELVHPRIGILTSLGPAHLERFGSMDAIEQAEGELADALPPDGLFVTRADDERCRRVAADRAGCRVLLFTPAPHPEADVWAESIAVSSGGTDFEIHWRDEPEPLAIRSRLLGEPNVANLLAAAAVARDRGSTPAQIARALRRVAPPKHRLEPIVNQAGGIVVIDDSYNSNPVGAAAALKVLEAHEAGRRILVTPGMVELGPQEAEENRRLGELAAAVCDVCLLSGPLVSHIRAGLLDGGLAESQIIVAPDGPSLHAELARLSRRGDVILFENDLPDVYG
jgi:UDP-N-acetylmuramoyl-tripeptide--D-alanyl-D-alanine ligase